MVDFPNEADAERVETVSNEVKETTAAIKAGPPDTIADFIKFLKEPKPAIRGPRNQCRYCKAFNRISHCNANWGECDCPQCQGFCECS